MEKVAARIKKSHKRAFLKRAIPVQKELQTMKRLYS
jgi:hypothetical protein